MLDFFEERSVGASAAFLMSTEAEGQFVSEPMDVLKDALTNLAKVPPAARLPR